MTTPPSVRWGALTGQMTVERLQRTGGCPIPANAQNPCTSLLCLSIPYLFYNPDLTGPSPIGFLLRKRMTGVGVELKTGSNGVRSGRGVKNRAKFEKKCALQVEGVPAWRNMKRPESVSLELRAPSAQVERYGSVGMNPPIHCFFPLSTEEASREYELLARKLSEAGRLTLARHRALSSYALQVDCIVKAKSEGREPPGLLARDAGQSTITAETRAAR